MKNVYASAINKLTGNIRIKDADIHCDEPLIGNRVDANIKITECNFILENPFCCVAFPPDEIPGVIA